MLERAEAGFTHGDVMFACFNPPATSPSWRPSGAPAGRGDRRRAARAGEGSRAASPRRRSTASTRSSSPRRSRAGPTARPRSPTPRARARSTRSATSPRSCTPTSYNQQGYYLSSKLRLHLVLPRVRPGAGLRRAGRDACCGRSAASSRRSSSSSSTGSRCSPMRARPAIEAALAGRAGDRGDARLGAVRARAVRLRGWRSWRASARWARADRAAAVELFTAAPRGADRHHAALAPRARRALPARGGDARAAREHCAPRPTATPTGARRPRSPTCSPDAGEARRWPAAVRPRQKRIRWSVRDLVCRRAASVSGTPASARFPYCLIVSRNVAPGRPGRALHASISVVRRLMGDQRDVAPASSPWRSISARTTVGAVSRAERVERATAPAGVMSERPRRHEHRAVVGAGGEVLAVDQAPLRRRPRPDRRARAVGGADRLRGRVVDVLGPVVAADDQRRARAAGPDQRVGDHQPRVEVREVVGEREHRRVRGQAELGVHVGERVGRDELADRAVAEQQVDRRRRGPRRRQRGAAAATIIQPTVSPGPSTRRCS